MDVPLCGFMSEERWETLGYIGLTSWRRGIRATWLFSKGIRAAVAVMVDPDTAQGILHEEDGYAYQFAADNAHLKMEPPVVEDERSDDALCDVVGHAHAAIGDEQGRGRGRISWCNNNRKVCR